MRIGAAEPAARRVLLSLVPYQSRNVISTIILSFRPQGLPWRDIFGWFCCPRKPGPGQGEIQDFSVVKTPSKSKSIVDMTLVPTVRNAVQELLACLRGEIIEIEQRFPEFFKRHVGGKVPVQARCGRRVKECPPVRV